MASMSGRAKAEIGKLKGAYGNFNVLGTAASRMGEATAPKKGKPNYGKKDPNQGVQVIRGQGGKGGRRY